MQLINKYNLVKENYQQDHQALTMMKKNKLLDKCLNGQIIKFLIHQTYNIDKMLIIQI